jgi:transposase
MVSMDEAKRKKRPRRIFTDEFKTGAVRLVLDEGKSITEVAHDLDLTVSAFRGWVERERAERTKGKTGLTAAEREELKQLRKQVRELQMERDILKKAAVSSCGESNMCYDAVDGQAWASRTL